MPKSDINNITLPVYKRLHGEIEQAKAQIPTSAEITALANTAIQADKEMLSKIHVFPESDSISFPRNIQPIRYYSESLGVTLYFNYSTLEIIDETGTNRGTMTVEDSTVDVEFTDDFAVDLENDDIDYILFDKNCSVDWYSVLNPTKPIYYHPIYIIQNTHTDTDDVECRCTLVIMDNSSTPYTTTSLLAKLKQLMDLGAYIQINGYFKDSSSVVNNIYMAQKFGDNDYRVYANNSVGRNQTAIENIINERSDIADGVNRIN